MCGTFLQADSAPLTLMFALIRVYPEHAADMLRLHQHRITTPRIMILLIEAYPACAEEYLDRLLKHASHESASPMFVGGPDIVRILLVRPDFFERTTQHLKVLEIIQASFRTKQYSYEYTFFAYDLFKAFPAHLNDPNWENFDNVLAYCVRTQTLSSDSVKNLIPVLAPINVKKLLIDYLQLQILHGYDENFVAALVEGLRFYPEIIFEVVEYHRHRVNLLEEYREEAIRILQ